MTEYDDKSTWASGTNTAPLVHDMDWCDNGPAGAHQWGDGNRCAACGGFAQDTETQFAKRLERLLNAHSRENASNTPDFILAQYLLACLDAWNRGVQQRETWYGRDARPCSIQTAVNPSPVFPTDPANR